MNELKITGEGFQEKPKMKTGAKQVTENNFLVVLLNIRYWIRLTIFINVFKIEFN